MSNIKLNYDINVYKLKINENFFNFLFEILFPFEKQ